MQRLLMYLVVILGLSLWIFPSESYTQNEQMPNTWDKPIRWIFQGDKLASQKLMGKAKTQLFQLKNIQGARNSEQFMLNRYFRNGSSIFVRTDVPGMDIVKINTLPEEEYIEKKYEQVTFIYVGYTHSGGNDFYRKYTIDRELIHEIETDLIETVGITADEKNVFVSDDSVIGKIKVYKASDGDFDYEIPPSASTWIISGGIVAEKYKNVLYVCDVDGNKIVKLTKKGEFIKQWGEWGYDGGQFQTPMDITIDKDYIYVCEYNGSRVQVFDKEGNFKHAFGSQGSLLGQLYGPQGIAVDSDRIYVAEYVNKRIQVFNKDGISLFTFTRGAAFRPMDVFVHEKYVYVPDGWTRQVYVADKDGNWQEDMTFGYSDSPFFPWTITIFKSDMKEVK